MIVDTSAVIALVFQEGEATEFARVLAESDITRISAATYLEAGIVLDSRQDPALSRQLDHLIDSAEMVIESVTAEQARAARVAYRDFGKGSGHPAQLNFGDCFAYALAVEHGEPLLFKGAGFSRTDVTPVWRP